MRIALYQARTGIDPAANAADLVAAVREAAAGEAAILFTPEPSVCMASQRKLTRISPPKPAGSWKA